MNPHVNRARRVHTATHLEPTKAQHQKPKACDKVDGDSVRHRLVSQDRLQRRKIYEPYAALRATGMVVLPIVVVVDVDPDWRIPGASRGAYRGNVRWDGLTKGVPKLLDMMKGLTDSSGRSVRFTWMLRSDGQMAELQGDPAYVATAFRDFWDERRASGDEIGWHPHTWRYSEHDAVWYQERDDVDWIQSSLRDGYDALARKYPIRVAKTGWTWHSNLTMRLFASLGLQVDVSALPGMSYHGSISGTRLPLGQYDWRRAPQEPYHPRPDDYQVPGDGNSLAITEVPNWTFPVPGSRQLYHAIRGRSSRDFANPAKHPRLMRQAFGNPPSTLPFVCYFHPEELLHSSRLFAIQNVVDNLRVLRDECAERGIRTRASVASELVLT